LTPLVLKAWSSLACELSHAEAAAIRESGLVDVVAEPEPGRWRLESNSRVGVAVGAGWELRVNPRIEVPQLFFLLAYALDPDGWIDQRADFAAHPDFFDAIASGFSWHALRTIEHGVLRGYVEVEEQLRGLRGRIRFGDQIARSAALPIPMEVSYDDYTADVAENRILKSAAIALLRLPRVPPLARRRLLKIRAVLDEVSALSHPREVRMPLFTRLNERCRPALRLAEMILRASSLEGSRGPVASVAFVFDMNRVFEDFLSVSLRESLRRHGGEVRLQAAGWLDREGSVAIRPDVTWWEAGRPRAVVDAKYKVLGSSGVRNEDAYQMLSYCTALGLDRGYLVYAAGGAERERTVEVRNSPCRVCVRTVDVEQPPESVLGQVADLVGELVGDRALRAAI
jgi:5-methylcytosine-specific restriction enzyme subunit McrC